MTDLIITNARVWTVDRDRPEAEALAIERDRVVAVGTRAEIGSLKDSHTRVVDAGWRRVLPGFNDAHVHLWLGATQLSSLDLRDVSDARDFVERIAERARRLPGDWIQGGGWDEQSWKVPALPDKGSIDPVTPGTPVFVKRCDVHMALANSAALERAGVTRDTPDPPGGTIGRDAGGNPTGILKDSAMRFVERVVPPVTSERRVVMLKRALAHLARFGVTSVRDMVTGYDDLEAYQQMAARGELTARISAAPLETAMADGSMSPLVPADPFLRVDAAKGFADGSLGSSTALFFDPYSDEPGNSGLLSDEMQPLEGMRGRLTAIDRAGVQICLHAIGDRAVSMTLDLCADLVRTNGPRDRRFRVEHAQHVRPADFDRFAALNVVASVQPSQVVDDGRWAEKRIGPERAKTTYAFRSFLDRGIRLALGTDWPVVPLDPMRTLHAAVTRVTAGGGHPGGWVPEQRISVGEAIEGYTMGAAYAEFADREKGSVTPGKLADLVILGDDVLTIEADRIKDARVDMTIVGGRIVYER